MRYVFLLFLLFLTISPKLIYGNSIGGATEMKVKTELEESLIKLLPRESFVVQVSASVDTISEKQLMEGETIVQNNAVAEINVPPLPGFQPAPQQTQNQSPSQNRQVYRMVEKEILKSIRVEVTLNEALDPAIVTQAKGLVTSYLKANFSDKAFAIFNMIKMIPSQQNIDPNAAQTRQQLGKSMPFDLKTILLLSSTALLFLLLLLLVFKRRLPQTVYPTIMHPNEQEMTSETGSTQPRFTVPPDTRLHQPKLLALPSDISKGKREFPALPATQDFVNRRSELLESFLKNAETFRLYYKKLPEAAQSELYAGLRGPAFDSLLDVLELPRPKSTENLTPPSEEQMIFYGKNFDEFVQTQSWHNSQFFGFLHQMTHDQILTLIRQENPTVSALVVQFLKPDQTATMLKALTSKERTDILHQSTRVKKLVTEELVSIENTVREHVSKLPKFLLGYNKEDVEFWSKILIQTEDQEQILMDLEKSRPDLYPALAKYRFKLEDLPSLSEPLVNKVLSEVDNEQLAQALSSCTKDVVEFVLNKLNSNRKELVTSHIQMCVSMSPEDLSKARLALTLRFREVMT